jgi:ABC-type Co2+ transport system permease subunit
MRDAKMGDSHKSVFAYLAVMLGTPRMAVATIVGYIMNAICKDEIFPFSIIFLLSVIVCKSGITQPMIDLLFHKLFKRLNKEINPFSTSCPLREYELV